MGRALTERSKGQFQLKRCGTKDHPKREKHKLFPQFVMQKEPAPPGFGGDSKEGRGAGSFPVEKGSASDVL